MKIICNSACPAATGAWKVTEAAYRGREFTPVAYEIASPDDYGFMHDIVLQQGARLFTQAAFSLDMTVDIEDLPGFHFAFEVTPGKQRAEATK
jgi:hypothetical protein